MFIRDLTYDFPQASYLLLWIFPLFLLYWLLFRYRQQVLLEYTSPALLSHLMLPRSRVLAIIKVLLLLFSWIFASLALMGPKGNLQYQSLTTGTESQPADSKKSTELRHRAHDVIFLLDVSGSMAVRDVHDQTRLAAAKEIIEQIVSQLRGQNVSLYGFTSELIPLVPPTLDYLFLRLQLKQVHINEGDTQGTDFTKVLEMLKEKIFSEPSPKLYTLIMLTDGGDNQIESLQGQAKEQAIQKLLTIIPNAKELNLRLFTIGVGSKAGGIVPDVKQNGQPVHSKLEEDLLKKLASQDRGVYYEAYMMPPWNLAQDLISKMEQDSPYEEGTSLATGRKVIPARQEDFLYHLYFQIPLGLALLLLFLYFILPDVRRV